ncbi:MAG TPA: hypothetical protein VJT75_14295 [Thermoleophilaceae bacterium]|nr:hypothetical protein [Thermoleophilaceae bacterium]
MARTPTLRWAGRARKPRLTLKLAWAAVGLFVIAFLFGVASWAFGGGDGFFGTDKSCGDNSFGCNLTAEMLGGAAAVAVAVVYFTSWRIKRVIRPHLKDAADHPDRLVPTASPIERVVGRDGLCEIIEKDLVERGRARPQVIVAGVGDGKTAALVALTKYLFERGAIPVPIALRDAVETLDFRDLAKKRFLDRVGPSLLSEDEGDKVWRELCNDRLVVILADGLEEALPRITDPQERAKEIQVALATAGDLDLPLVIATRPHDGLEDLDVAKVRLEPLFAQDVVEYIVDAGDGSSDERVTELARIAEVMERPLYLRLARELHRQHRLSQVAAADRVRTRSELLAAWRKLLVEHPPVEARVRREDRIEALATAEDLACVALVENTLEIRYDAVTASPYVPAVTEDNLAKTRVFARHAERLELVESIKGGVRFRHSIMQAYLGACRLPKVLNGGGNGASYLDDALRDPGRELMMALVMSCLQDGAALRPADLRERLCTAAGEQFSDHRSFELLAAAYEIHALADDAEARKRLADVALDLWRRPSQGREKIETTEAKLRVLLPIAEAGMKGDAEAYRALWEICLAEDTYVVRFQAAQHLAAAGAAAVAAAPEQIKGALGHARDLLTYGGGPPRAGWEDVRRFSILGWVVPLLWSTSGAETVREEIEAWVELAKAADARQPGLHLGVEAALAQGFKWEANRMLGGEPRERRTFLIDRALELLDATHWWQTEVALLQALALWALDDDEPRRSDIRKCIRSYERRGRHPFVRQAASNAAAAVRLFANPAIPVRDRGPSRYLWIDEVGVASKIGRPDLPPDPITGLWIPPAAGWHALKTRAGQLVGDMLVYLNLLEGRERGGADPDRDAAVRDREKRRADVYVQGGGLPVCLTAPPERSRLKVDREAGDSPEEALLCANEGCEFGLCPYPARDQRPFRGDLPETFCREQQRRLRGREARIPPWTERVFIAAGPALGSRVAQLRQFWGEMERRDQGA